MAKWIVCDDDPLFWTCSNCGYLSDWRESECPECSCEMEDTESVFAKIGDYEAVQSGGDLCINVYRQGRHIMHALQTTKMTEDELLDWFKNAMFFLVHHKETKEERKKRSDEIKRKIKERNGNEDEL